MSEEKVKYSTSTIAEMTGGIILANFEKDLQVRETAYQSEAELERQMIENLVSQGYERLIVKSNDELYIISTIIFYKSQIRLLEKEKIEIAMM